MPTDPPTPGRTAYADLTNAVAEHATPPAAGQIFIRDSRLPGFALRVTSGGIKSWIVEARMRGQSATKRRTLGRFPAVKADRARTLAIQELGRFAEGVDRLAEERTARARGVTLAQVFDDYLAGRDLKPVTVGDYRKAFTSCFEDWSDTPMTGITRSMVERRHKEASLASPARANLSMRLLRALFNFAIGKYEDGEGAPVIVDNPVKRLSAVRAWNTIERRRTLIRLHQMPAWFDAVERLRSLDDAAPVVADWLEFLILTGCRRTESLSLTWEEVNLPARFFRLPDTKNRQVHELPLSDRLHAILESRYPGRGAVGFVFPGKKTGTHLIEERRWLRRVAAESEVPFSPHDLRRTFATVAEGLDIPVYTIKRLMNHASGSGDVTAGYIQIDVERLRVPMQRITDTILTAAGRKGAPATVVDIQSARR